MKKLTQSILIAGFSVGMLAAGSSFAACMDGPYVSGNLAVNWLNAQNYRLDSANTPSGSSLHLPSNTGWGGGLAVGSQNGPYRLEAALDYLTSRAKNGSQYIAGSVDENFSATTTGRVAATTLLVNGYYDFMPDAAWTPYVGVGLGVANINSDITATSVTDTSPTTESIVRIHDNSNKFAYQGIVGASWKVNDRLKANVDYRYLGATRASFNMSATDTTAPSTTTNGTANSRYSSNRVTAGLTYYID